jgi:hypothetical protein
MKHKYTFYKTFDVPPVKLVYDFSPSWWEGVAILIFYFGSTIIFWGLALYFIFRFFS